MVCMPRKLNCIIWFASVASYPESMMSVPEGQRYHTFAEGVRANGPSLDGDRSPCMDFPSLRTSSLSFFPFLIVMVSLCSALP